MIDFDDRTALSTKQLRPSQVAAHQRQATQSQAASVYIGHPETTGIRWWSTLKASWINLTISDRGLERLELEETTILEPSSPLASEAAESLGLQAPSGE